MNLLAFPILSIPPMYPLDESFEDLTIRTGYEAGYDHTRPKYSTAFRKTYKVKYTHITQYDKLLLDSFLSSVDGGASSFIWANPANNVIVNRVRNGGFNVNTKSWGSNYGTLSSVEGGYAGNCLSMYSTTGPYAYAELESDITPALTTDAHYRFSVWVKSGTAGDQPYLVGMITPGVAWGYNYSGVSSNVWTNVTFPFIANTYQETIVLMRNCETGFTIANAIGTILFDEASVVDATQEIVVGFATLPQYTYITKDYWDCEFSLFVDSTPHFDVVSWGFRSLATSTGTGIWMWNGKTYSRITSNITSYKRHIVIDNILYVDFNGNGIYKYYGVGDGDETSWIQITSSATCLRLCEYNHQVCGDFGGANPYWVYSGVGTTWTQIYFWPG